MHYLLYTFFFITKDDKFPQSMCYKENENALLLRILLLIKGGKCIVKCNKIIIIKWSTYFASTALIILKCYMEFSNYQITIYYVNKQ